MRYILTLLLVSGVGIHHLRAWTLAGSCTSEVQYRAGGRGNWCNLLRFDFGMPVGAGGNIEVATLHFFKADSRGISDDALTFSNIEEDCFAASFAVLGYRQQLGILSLFAGLRNLNEDYFTERGMSLFTNSSCGIFPTLSLNGVIANYPLSSLGLHWQAADRGWCYTGSIYNGHGYRGWRKDGVFSIQELKYTTSYGRYSCGGTLHTHGMLCAENEQPEIPEGHGSPTARTEKKINGAWWGFAEQRLWKGAGMEADLLLHYSQTFRSPASCRRYTGIGCVLSGEEKRGRITQAGIYLQHAWLSSGIESDLEITCRVMLGDAWVLQPAIHLIRSQGETRPVAMLRFCYDLVFH